MNEEPDDQQAPDWAVDQPQQEADDDQPTGSIQSAAPDWARDEGTQAPEQAQGEAVPDWATEGDTSGADNVSASQRERAASGDEWSPAGSAAVGAATGVLPVGGAAAAGVYVGAATSPFITPVGGFLAGLGTFGLLNYLGESAQDKLLGIMGLDSTVKAAMEDNPTAFEVGHMAPGLATGSPIGTLAQRGVGAAMGGAGAAIMDATQGKFDPKNIAIGAGMGAAVPGANNVGSKLIASGEKMGQRIGGNLFRGEGGRYRGGNTNPDLKEVPEETASPLDAAPQEDEITVNNDVTMTAPGVAMENGPVPEVDGAGNPAGAPMLNRDAARPSDPSRNYQKDQAQTQPDTTESKVIDTEPMHSDIKEALTGAEPESASVPHSEGTDVLPEEAAPTIQPEQDNHTPGVQARAQIPETLGPEETSRAQRERVADVQQRMAASQKGEDYPDAVPGNHAVHEPEQAAAAPQALTPEEMKSLAEDRKIMAKHGWDRALAALDSVSPRRQLEAVRQAANTIRQGVATEQGVKPSEAEVRRPGRAGGNVSKESRQKVAETGVLAASKADAARKSAAINTVKGVYDEFGPQSDKGKLINPLDPDKTKDMKAYTKQVWDAAVKANGGRDPLVRSKDQYVPIQKGDHTDAYQWLKAVKASAKGQNHKNFMTLHTTEGMGKLDAETGRVEGDIAHRPQINEAGGEAETATGAMEQSRTTFEHLNPDPRPGADNSYVEDHNKLADWLNDRSPNEYSKLADSYDLRAEMDEPGDPASLLSEMKQHIADNGRRPKGEITSEVDLPAKKVDVPNLPTPKEVTNPGRSLKGTDEFKRLAAMYEQQETPRTVKSKTEQLADLAAKGASMKEAEQSTAKLEEERRPFDYREAVKGGWGDLADKLGRFAGDEHGGAKIPQWLLNRFSPSNPAAPNAKPEIREYADSIGEEFKKHIGREKNILMETNARLAAAPDLDGPKWSSIGKAVVDRATAALPADLKQVYDDHVKPLRDKADKLYREVYQFNKDHNIGMDLPDPDVQGPAKDFMPRRLKGDQVYDKDEMDKFDPLSGRTLSVYSPSLMEREWSALHNPKTGQRLTVQRTEDADGAAKLTVWRNGSPQVLKNTQPALQGKVGDKISLTIKGQKQDWLFDHGTPDEIKAATAGKVEYHDNPMVMFSQQVDDLAKNLNNMKLVEAMKNDPRWQEHTTTSLNEAKAKGYDLNPVELEALGRKNGRPVYMPANLRWALNDFFKKGFGGTELDPLRRLSANAFKTFFALTPFVHPLNELDLAIVSRGSQWLPGTGGYRSLFRNLPRAIQSVNNQDYHQKNISAFGGNPMLASVKVREMYPDAARRMGMDIANNQSKWDPIAKVWGVSTADLAKTVYNASSDVTWRLSDYLLTLRYMENMDQGHSIESAVREAHKFVSDYHMPTTVMGKGKTGRLVSSALSDPFLTAFGRYKYGVFKSIANMTKDIAKGTPAQRNKALGQLGAAVAMAWIVYPALDKGLQAISGNDKAEMGRRGISAIPRAVNESIQKRSPNPILTHTVTSAPAISMLKEGVSNQDWNGKPIVPEGVWPNPVRTGAYVGDWAARNLVPPYNSISQGMAKEGGGVLPTLGHFAGEQVGAKFPTERAGKFEGQAEKRVNTQEKQRLKHGEPGVLPDLYDRFTGRK